MINLMEECSGLVSFLFDIANVLVPFEVVSMVTQIFCSVEFFECMSMYFIIRWNTW